MPPDIIEFTSLFNNLRASLYLIALTNHSFHEVYEQQNVCLQADAKHLATVRPGAVIPFDRLVAAIDHFVELFPV